MKHIKVTPFLIVSIGFILCGLYALLFISPDKEGWGTLSAIIIIGAGVVGIIVYVLLRAIFKKRIWTQVAFEIAIIFGIMYFRYKKMGAYEFSLPYNYRGYVILVYGVADAPALKPRFYSNKIRLKVPSSGIILTSSSPINTYSDPAIFLDSTLGVIDELPRPLTRYGVPLSSDTLKCKGKNYLFDIWLIKDEPSWSSKDDTINRLDLKLIDACSLINQ